MRLNILLIGVSLVSLGAPAFAQTAPSGRQDVPSPGAKTAAPTTTLQDALAQAYATNPDLQSERANQRANDENVPIARSQGLPGLNATGSANDSLYNTDATALTPSRQAQLGLNLSQPIYNGGRIRNSVRAAEVRVNAGRANLRGTEADIFTQTVTAYLNVIRDESIVRLNQENVHVLEVNLQATRDRFQVGDLTRTDVAQSEARLALAQSQLRSAEAQLIGSRETYIRVVGTPPGVLAPPPPLPNLPQDVQTAEQVALANNPFLEAAQLARDATRFDTRVARAGRLPQVSLGLGGNYYNYLGSVGEVGQRAGLNPNGTNATVGVQVTLPLFQAGRPAAQVRQAQAREGAAIEQVTLTERGVIAQARSAYASYQAALRVIESSRTAVQANQLSLEGVRAENSVGTRTILDILNAEQELLNSQVQYVTAERDAYVAGFSLLAAMGRAQAKDLSFDSRLLYDPAVNYTRVRNRINDWRDDKTPAPVASSTRGTPAQGAEVIGAPLDPTLQRSVDSDRPNP
ncbi:Outer membrane efflux protein BepC [Sphingomonas sp. S2M10]|uniref:TolC family outer membrane protein n=1 Tax=Sphingomonas sp. S2M10 TaxID=2705010 RepID=UPI001456A2E2|nr:TolC family outer membrane protein [Sphingomonas sp. S2M10]NLS26530.1 Outer membrane efflux protein BepC [Sphingomonas sp. S2M10]